MNRRLVSSMILGIFVLAIFTVGIIGTTGSPAIRLLQKGSTQITAESSPLPFPRDVTWDEQMTTMETTNATTDYVIFGEAPDARDGPPADPYDVVKPPEPMTPYTRIWLKDNLPVPYHNLWKDYRRWHALNVKKTWNATVQWVPIDSGKYPSTSLTLSWGTDGLSVSEYDKFELFEYSSPTYILLVPDMMTTTHYEYTAYAWIPKYFKINCTRDTTPPSIIDYSPDHGETGDPYTFSVAVSDDMSSPLSLLVRVIWTHGSLSGDNQMSYNGERFVYTIPALDQNTDYLTYHFYAQDNAKNPNSVTTGDFQKPVVDDEWPEPQSDDTTASPTSSNPMKFGLSITDNINIQYVTANYQWRQGGLWSSWVTDVPMTKGTGNTWATSSINIPADATTMHYYFEAYDGTSIVFIYNGSLAVTQNEATAQASPFTKPITDDIAPSILADNSPSQGVTGGSYVFDVTPGDNIGVGLVTVTWVHGVLGETDAVLTYDGDGTWSKGITLSLSSVADMTYTIKVRDLSGNWFTGPLKQVTVFDTVPPQIIDITANPNAQLLNNPVNITATITDNINLNEIKIAITGPEGFTPVNTTMLLKNSNQYYYNSSTYSVIGMYTYSIWAKDTNNNAIRSPSYQFEIFAELQITTLKTGWNFVSLPFNLTTPKTNLFIISGGTRYTWSQAAASTIIYNFIYDWNRITQGYGDGSIAALTLGEGYWMYAYSDCQLWATNMTPMVSDNFVTVLKPGWNIIGIPINTPISKTTLFINNGTTDIPWANAVGIYVMNELFGWQRSPLPPTYFIADTLQPGEAYWLYAFTTCTLKR